MCRSLKTAKSRDKRFTGYDIPFHEKPIKIHWESSCTSGQYGPNIISTRGLVVSKLKNERSKITLNSHKENTPDAVPWITGNYYSNNQL